MNVNNPEQPKAQTRDISTFFDWWVNHIHGDLIPYESTEDFHERFEGKTRQIIIPHVVYNKVG